MQFMPCYSIFFIAAVTACDPTVTPVDPDYPDSPEGCARACENGRKLGCEFALDSPAGGRCEAICENAENEGRMWQSPCLASATSCDEADRCGEPTGEP